MIKKIYVGTAYDAGNRVMFKMEIAALGRRDAQTGLNKHLREQNFNYERTNLDDTRRIILVP